MEKKTIQALFLRWLKNNNLFHIYKYCIANYPSSLFPMEKWITNSFDPPLSNDKRVAKAKFGTLVMNSPFAWNKQTNPRNFNTPINIHHSTWERVDEEWKKYFASYCTKKHL